MNFYTSWEGILEAFGAIFHDIQSGFAFFKIFHQFAMVLNHNFIFFLYFLSIFFVIQWKVYILSISHVIQSKFEAWEVWGGGWTDGHTEIHPCPTGHRPFGTAAQKQLRSIISWCFSRLLLNQDRPSDRLMNRRADGQTNPFYRISWLQLKQGRIHGNSVAVGWAGAQMPKQLGIQKCYGRMDQPTDTARCSRVSATKNECGILLYLD